MDFDLSKEQEIIRSSIKGFLEKEYPLEKVRELEEDEKGYDPELWKKMAELGWLGINLPEEYGGSEADITDLMIVVEEMGSRLLSGPFFSTMVLCSIPLMEYGSSAQREEFLPKIARGKQIWAFAFNESSAANDLTGVELHASQEGDSYLLSGTKLFVPYAHVADYLLVVGRTGEGHAQEITVFIVDTRTPGLTIEVIPTTAKDKQCEIKFDNTEVPKSNVLGNQGQGADIVNYIFQRGAALKSAEMLGGIQTVLKMTNDYAKERVQFGRPIGSFQAIQHRLVDLFIDIEGLRYIVYEAVWNISYGSPSDLLISIAKAKANEIYQRTCIDCIRVHGAVGFTRELDLGLYHLRTKASEFTLGDSRFHKEKIAAELERCQAPVFAPE